MHKSELHVISVISNPVMFRSRLRLFREYYQRMLDMGIDVWVAEAVTGERPFEITNDTNPRHIQVRCDDDIWLKEALINRAVQQLPRNWKYVAWVDADIEFYNKEWVMDTIHQLQHHAVVQPFSHAIDLGPKGEVLQTHQSFGYCHAQGHKLNVVAAGRQGYPPFFHPGYAFAWRRDAWETVGGLIDYAICGAGDHHMSCALLGEAKQSIPGHLHENYYKMIYQWQERALKLKMNIGFVPGTIMHHFHGSKADRGYQSRWEILQKHKYDPQADIMRDWQGMPVLSGNKNGLRDDMRKYFRQRNEDNLGT
jgi:hypothetical protein